MRSSKFLYINIFLHTAYSMQLGPHTSGHVTLRLGNQQGLTTLLMHETALGSLALATHLGTQECCVTATGVRRVGQDQGHLKLHCKWVPLSHHHLFDVFFSKIYGVCL